MIRARPYLVTPAVEDRTLRQYLENLTLVVNSLPTNAFADIRFDYGARGDGVTDDTLKIQKAIDDVAAAGGGVVYVPLGTFMVDQLRMKSKVTLKGSGWGSVIKQRTYNGHLVVMHDVNVEHTTLEHLKLDGNKAAQSTTNHGVYFEHTGGVWTSNDQNHMISWVLIQSASGTGIMRGTNTRGLRVVDTWIRECAGNSTASAPVTTGTDSWFVRVISEASGLSGFACQGGNDFYIACKAFGSGQLAVANDGAGFRIECISGVFVGCYAQENGEHGFRFDTVNCQGCVGTACVADSNGGANFQFERAFRCVFTGCLSTDTPALVEHPNYAVAFTANATSNIIHLQIAGTYLTNELDITALGNNIVEDQQRYEAYHSLGQGSAGGDEHFKFGQTGSPDALQPEFIFKSESVGGADQARFEAYDATDTKVFLTLDFAGGTLGVGSAGANPIVPLLPVFTNATRPAATSISGAIIFNSDDGLLNISNGADWLDPTGAVT